MAGIFPASGVVATGAINSILDPNLAAGCTGLWYAPKCNPRLDTVSANATISEIVNAVNCMGLSYNCARLDNLCLALQTLQIKCRSELTVAPAAGVPRVYLDNTVSPAVMYFWDCTELVYRKLDPSDESVKCRSQLAAAPALGVPRMYIDDTVNPATIVYWDCGQSVYRTISVTASTPELFTSSATPPVAPITGDHWQNTSLGTVSGIASGQLAIWSGAAWVQSSNPSTVSTNVVLGEAQAEDIGLLILGTTGASIPPANRIISPIFSDVTSTDTPGTGGLINFVFAIPQADALYKVTGGLSLVDPAITAPDNTTARTIRWLMNSDITVKTVNGFSVLATFFSAAPPGGPYYLNGFNVRVVR